jgi:hypothetical protein
VCRPDSFIETLCPTLILANIELLTFARCGACRCSDHCYEVITIELLDSMYSCRKVTRVGQSCGCFAIQTPPALALTLVRVLRLRIQIRTGRCLVAPPA